MAQPPKKPDLAALIILDSNALFTENDVEIVSKEARENVSEFATFGGTVIIPRVVLRELLFRKLVFLRGLEAEARRNRMTIGKLTGLSVPSLPSYFALLLRLARRWKQWCRELKIEVESIPFDEINWRKMCSSAIHRLPPFSPFDPKGKSEKGFRDALLLETLSVVVRKSTQKKVVFITNDSLLHDAVNKRGLGNRLSIYRSSAEYLSYLKLEKDNFVKGLISFAIEESAKEFYTEGNPQCIYNRFGVFNKIQAEFHEQLSRRPTPAMANMFMISPTYRDSTRDGVRIKETNIRKYDGEGSILYLSTAVQLGRVIRSSNVWEFEQIRIAEFVVEWRGIWYMNPSKVEGLALDRILEGKVTFEQSNDELLAAFNLPTLMQRILGGFPLPTTNPETG